MTLQKFQNPVGGDQIIISISIIIIIISHFNYTTTYNILCMCISMYASYEKILFSARKTNIDGHKTLKVWRKHFFHIAIQMDSFNLNENILQNCKRFKKWKGECLITLGFVPYTISNYAGIVKGRLSKKLTNNKKKLSTDNWSWKELNLTLPCLVNRKEQIA